MDYSAVKTAIHTLSSLLETPAIIVLLLAAVIVVAQLGSLIIEFFGTRFRKKLDVTKVLDEIAEKIPAEILEILNKNSFQKSQKKSFEKMIKHKGLPEEKKKLYAVQLLSDEANRHDRILYVTDIIARIAPMFGLMATLIPLGPGLIALGQGDTATLSSSLMTAFDATVAGLAAAGVAYIISKVRKRWYQFDMDAMETVLEGMIE